MLYLIPEEQHKKIIHEYSTKVINIFSYMFIIIIATLGILAIPTFILLQVDMQSALAQVESLEDDIVKNKKTDSEKEVLALTNKIKILEKKENTSIIFIRKDIEKIFESIEGVTINTVNIDSMLKIIQIVTEVRDKEVARELVDALEKTKYKGAVLSYNILSKKGSFVFAQNLNYE